MPQYDYICAFCNHKTTVIQPMEKQLRPMCPSCREPMKKDWSQAPAYHDVPFDSVDFDLTGKPIVYHTRGQLKRIAKEHGCDVDFGARSRETRR